MKETLKFGKEKNNPKGADRDPMKINNKTFDNFNYNSADIKKNSKLKFKHFNYEQMINKIENIIQDNQIDD